MKKIANIIGLSLLFASQGSVFAASVEDDPNKQNVADLQQSIQQLQKMMVDQQKQKALVPPTNLSAPLGQPTVPVTNQGPQPPTIAAPTAPKRANPVADKQNDEKIDMYEEAFANVVNQLLPMTPEQIAKLKESFSDAQRAQAAPAGVPPKPTSSSIVVDLSPQATPPIIRLQAGYITSLVFMDATGQAWPVSAYSIGDPSAYNIQWDKQGNTLLIQAISLFKRSNLAVILKNLNTPVMLTLMPGQAAVDYRVDLRVPGIGPNAVFAQSSSLPNAANPLLLDVLNAVPPPNSKVLKVNGSNDVQAWVVGKTMYLRTHLDIISPAWKAIMTSMDGTHAYEIQASSIVLALEHGKDKTITLTLEGWE
jgi:intracellular multiplication protein IcmK